MKSAFSFSFNSSPCDVITDSVSAGKYVGLTPSFQRRTYSCPLDHSPCPLVRSAIAFHLFLAAMAPSSRSSLLSQVARFLFSISNPRSISPGPNTAPCASASSAAKLVAMWCSERRDRNCAMARAYALVSGMLWYSYRLTAKRIALQRRCLSVNSLG
jgi:hypothetical protein